MLTFQFDRKIHNYLCYLAVTRNISRGFVVFLVFGYFFYFFFFLISKICTTELLDAVFYQVGNFLA